MELQDYFDIVMLIGSALALLMTFFLWFNPIKFFANRVLGWLTLIWAFTIFIFAMQSREFFVRFPHLFGIATGLALLYFPLLYIYIRSYLADKKWNVLALAVHFVPILVFFIAFSPFFIQSSEIKAESINMGIPDFVKVILKMTDVVVICQGIFYTILAVRFLHDFQFARKLSVQENSVVHRLKQFVVVNIILWSFGASGAFLEVMKFGVPYDLFNFFYLGLTCLTLGLGYFALKQPNLLIGMEFSTAWQLKKPALVSGRTRNEDIEKDAKLILEYIEKEKPYLKNDLGLQDLVEGSGLPKHRISEVFNSSLGKTFYDVINEYRTKEAIQLIKEGKYREHTLSHIAEMAGFNSKATFNRIFKKITDQTPSEFIQSISSSEADDL